jgi:hypothetical protein
MKDLLTIWAIWLILDIIAMELISHRKNGMNDIYELYDSWRELHSFASKIYVAFHLMLFLPFTIQ